MSNRDFAMARLSVVQSTLTAMRDDATAVVDLFIDPEEDEDGKQRLEILEGLEVGCHSLALALSAARDSMEGMDPAELKAPEEEEAEDEVNYQGPDPDDPDAGDGGYDPKAVGGGTPPA